MQPTSCARPQLDGVPSIHRPSPSWPTRATVHLGREPTLVQMGGKSICVPCHFAGKTLAAGTASPDEAVGRHRTARLHGRGDARGSQADPSASHPPRSHRVPQGLRDPGLHVSRETRRGMPGDRRTSIESVFAVRQSPPGSEAVTSCSAPSRAGGCTLQVPRIEPQRREHRVDGRMPPERDVCHHHRARCWPIHRCMI